LEALRWEVPDWIVIPGGNLGNVSALGKGFREMQAIELIDKMPRIVVAQSAQANPLYQSYMKNFDSFEAVPAKPTLANAIQIGNPVSREKAIDTLKSFGGIVEQATEQELADAAARADRTGLFTCPHTGVAFAALFKLVDRGVIKKRDRVVVISTAHGLKFTEFKLGYHQDTLKAHGVSAHLRNEPVVLPPKADVVRDAIFRAIEKNQELTG
ncbi:MAG: pyridoxal-phosphate dependent enzyme, partial [Candidatus Latescibacterota bacterium]